MIIDTHTHFYDPSRPQGVPWPDPDDNLLYRTALPGQYRALVKGRGVTGTVVVEASSWVEDNQWVLDLAAEDPFIVGLVGNLDPTSDTFSDHLRRFAANPLFSGIRVHGTETFMGSQTMVRRLALLAELDLELDLLMGVPDLPAVAYLAERIPGLRIVINHIAEVPIRGPDHDPDPAWIEGMQHAASHAHVYCKVSGLVEVTGQARAPTDVEFYRPTLDFLWNTFGENRLIYGSNWPVCERYADYATVQQIVDTYFTAKGPEASAKYFWKNAKSAYHWLER